MQLVHEQQYLYSTPLLYPHIGCLWCVAAVADVAVPRNLDKFSAQELEILVLGFHMLNFSSRNVARATLRLAELLPSVTPAFPETDPLPPDMQQQTAK